jgi:Zn-finger nucleic acid-binding protein
MKCPVCLTEPLLPGDPEANLRTLHCPQCSGQWLQSARYWEWREQHGENLPEIPASEAEAPPVEESGKGKLCPECSAILVPYKVGHELGFSLDRCARCGGIWFEKNEWEALRVRNLHDDIHFIFSHAWQAAIAQREREQAREERLRRTFGEEDYAELVRVKAWLDAHPHSRAFYAFLLDGRVENPR